MLQTSLGQESRTAHVYFRRPIQNPSVRPSFSERQQFVDGSHALQKNAYFFRAKYVYRNSSLLQPLSLHRAAMRSRPPSQ